MRVVSATSVQCLWRWYIQLKCLEGRENSKTVCHVLCPQRTDIKLRGCYLTADSCNSMPKIVPVKMAD